MRVIKPLRLGLLTRPFTLRGQHRLGVAVMAFATLDEAAVLLPESDLWKTMQSVMEEDEALDLSIPKPCAEFLVSGRVWAKQSEDPTRCAVRVRIDDIEKSLIVSGDRFWQDGRMTPPEAVDGVALDWRHTWGGADEEENPVGIGMVPDADGRPRVPNVEPLDGRILRPGQTGQIVGFGPVSPIRPRRFARAGKFDPNWLQNGFPGLPDTLDPHFFNTASPDQWALGRPAWRAGADYEIWNMHATRACVSGQLAPLQARCFIQRDNASVDDGTMQLEEVEMQLTTVWFLPDIERVLMVYHGAVPVATDDASDVVLIMPAIESRLDLPRSDEHYRRVLKQRLPRDTGAVYALNDSALMPAHHLRELDGAQVGSGAFERPQVVNQQRRAEHMRADMMRRVQDMGHDPADYPEPEPIPSLGSLDALPDYMRSMRRRARRASVDMARQQRKADVRMQQTFGDAPDRRGNKGAGLSELKKQVAQPSAGGPPKVGGASGASALREMARTAHADSLGQGGLTPAELDQQLTQAQADLTAIYRQAAHHQAAAEPALGGRSVRMRRRVQGLMESSRNLVGLDLTGIDLSGLDLSGARATGVLLEGANLTGTSFARADLTDAVLTRSDLTHTDLSDTVLIRANLGEVQASGTNFTRARLDATILDRAQFEDCDWSHSNIVDCVPGTALWRDCIFTQATLNNVVFWQDAVFSDTTFHQAELTRVVWLDSTLDGLDFEAARLTACAWVQSACEAPMRFSGAHLETCCAVDTDMTGAVFTDAYMLSCNWRGIAMDDADFSGACMPSCDFSQASLVRAVFAGASARESLFMSSDLQGTDFRDAELIDALMQKSDFRHADLRGANLFRSDISMSRLDNSTRTQGAYVRYAKTLPVGQNGAPNLGEPNQEGRS